MASLYSPGLPEVPLIRGTSAGDLSMALANNLRLPTASVQSVSSPLEISGINWKAVEAAELLAAIGAAYEQDRMRNKFARAVTRAEDRGIESMLRRAPKEAKRNRKRVERSKRLAGSGLFRDMAYILGMKQQNLY